MPLNKETKPLTCIYLPTPPLGQDIWFGLVSLFMEYQPF